jgi:hypothetical protein
MSNLHLCLIRVPGAVIRIPVSADPALCYLLKAKVFVHLEKLWSMMQSCLWQRDLDYPL